MRGPVDRWLVIGPEAEDDGAAGARDRAGVHAPGQEGSQPQGWPEAEPAGARRAERSEVSQQQPWPWPLPRPPGRRPEPLPEPDVREARAERIREATLDEEMREWKRGR